MSKLRIPPELGNVHSLVSTRWTAAWQRTPIPRLRNGYFKASVRMRTDVISLTAAARVVTVGHSGHQGLQGERICVVPGPGLASDDLIAGRRLRLLAPAIHLFPRNQVNCPQG